MLDKTIANCQQVLRAKDNDYHSLQANDNREY